MDGNIDEWDGQVPSIATDAQDQSSGRDVKGIYAANDGTYLYLRLESWNADAYDGNEFWGIDGDNSTTSGFNLFGGGIGSDLLVAANSMYCETTSTFNAGGASPNACEASPWSATENVELRFPLNTTLPFGDISQAFPGGLGSTIALIYGDGGTWDTCGPANYTLATSESPTIDGTLDDCSLYDTDGHALARTLDKSTVGSSALVGRTDGPGGASDHALSATLSLDTSSTWGVAMVRHRLIKPKNITGLPYLSVHVLGNASAAGKNLYVQIYDLDGTMRSRAVPFPTDPGWKEVNLGDVTNTSEWLQWANGSNSVLDLDQIVEWRLGIQNTEASQGGTFATAFDNLKATSIPVPIVLSSFELE